MFELVYQSCDLSESHQDFLECLNLRLKCAVLVILLIAVQCRLNDRLHHFGLPCHHLGKLLSGRNCLPDVQTKIVDKDEAPRADSSLEALSKLKPVFYDKGTITAGAGSAP